jgi:G:T-mismatch repair DNA endonuclease (very short patch repair protein)
LSGLQLARLVAAAHTPEANAKRAKANCKPDSSRRELVTCCGCNTQFKAWRCENRRLCSKQCPGRSQLGKSVTKTCVCGVTFKLRPCDVTRKQFCSRACGNQQRHKRAEVSLICVVCEKPFIVLNCHSKGPRARTCCGRRCTSIRAYQLQRNHDTDIEKIVESTLIQLGVIYEKQKAVAGISIPDFFILPNLCIYADGTYWHSSPQAIARDKYVNRKLPALGYRVIRLPEAVIKSNLIRPTLTDLLQQTPAQA